MGLFDIFNGGGGHGYKSANGPDDGASPYSPSNPYGYAPPGYGFLRVVDPSVPRGYRNVGLTLGQSRVIQDEGVNTKVNAFDMSGGFASPNPTDMNGIALDPNKQQTGSPTPGFTGPTTGPQGQTAGYVQPLQYTPQVNPFINEATQVNKQAQADTGYATSNLSSLQMKQAMSQYPTLPNAYGLGNSQQFRASPQGPGPALTGENAIAPTGPMAGNLTQSSTNQSSTGFNPWSLVGEASARG